MKAGRWCSPDRPIGDHAPPAQTTNTLTHEQLALRGRALWIACHTRSGVAGIGTSWTPSGASASRMAFITVGVAATVPPSPTPLIPSGLDLLGTGLKSTVIAGSVSARGMP